MKRFLWKFFPKKTESMDEFVDFVLRNGCTSVIVAQTSRALDQSGVAGLSMIDLLPRDSMIVSEYSVFCSATAPRGKRMIYTHMRNARYISPIEYGNECEKNELESFFAAEKCRTLLIRKFGTVNVEILGLAGMPMTKASHAGTALCK